MIRFVESLGDYLNTGTGGPYQVSAANGEAR